jgi:AmmeMemoRadiSam system protein A
MPMSHLQHNSPSAVTASEVNKSEGGKPLTGAASGHEFSSQEFSHEERSLLLRLAHDSISSALDCLLPDPPGLDHREISLDPPTPHLAEPRGVFTSLYLRQDRPKEELRGCVGYVLPSCTVYRAVAETARAAAFDDNRFPPVTKDEAPHLEIELSILSPPRPIRAEEIEIGRHGLVVTWHGRRGLLLPQVPVERAWDRTTFLEQTCRKAGLPLDAWQKAATIEAFTAEVFGDKNL